MLGMVGIQRDRGFEMVRCSGEVAGLESGRAAVDIVAGLQLVASGGEESRSRNNTSHREETEMTNCVRTD